MADPALNPDYVVRPACEREASCAPGDHTRSWPCDFAPGTGQLYEVARCDHWCELEGHNSPHLNPYHRSAWAALHVRKEARRG